MKQRSADLESRLPLLVLLDACCLLNLCATRLIQEILGTLPMRFAAADRAAAEVRYLRRGGGGPDAAERDPVELQALAAAGVLAILPFSTAEEQASFVQFAADVDDGEAMTCALAQHRAAAVATDDWKTLRLARALVPPLPNFTTADLIRQWADARQVTGDDLRQVLINVEERARFVPGRHDPLQPWWLTMTGRL